MWLSQSRPAWARYACWFGMAGEPFWFYTAFKHHQWGIMALACWYTFAWGKGLYTFWWLPYRAWRANKQYLLSVGYPAHAIHRHDWKL